MASFASFYLNIYHILSKLPVACAHLLPKTVQPKRVRDDCVFCSQLLPKVFYTSGHMGNKYSKAESSGHLQQ